MWSRIHGDVFLFLRTNDIESFQDLIDKGGLGNIKYNFTEDTITNNSNKSYLLEEYENCEDNDAEYNDDDQSTWGYKQGLCELVDSCHECP